MRPVWLCIVDLRRHMMRPELRQEGKQDGIWWAHEHMAYEHIEHVWAYEDMSLWAYEHMSIWAHEQCSLSILSIWVYWAYEHIGPMSKEHMSIWVGRHMMRHVKLSSRQPREGEEQKAAAGQVSSSSSSRSSSRRRDSHLGKLSLTWERHSGTYHALSHLSQNCTFLCIDRNWWKTPELKEGNCEWIENTFDEPLFDFNRVGGRAKLGYEDLQVLWVVDFSA